MFFFQHDTFKMQNSKFSYISKTYIYISKKIWIIENVVSIAIRSKKTILKIKKKSLLTIAAFIPHMGILYTHAH